jgi:hypothetical protein
MMNPLETGHQPSPRKKSQPQKPQPKTAKTPAKSGQQRRQARRSQPAALPAGKKTALQPPKSQPSQPISRFWKKWIADGVAFTLLFGGTALIGGCAWFSYQLIVNPDIGVWLNQLLPSWTQIPLQRRDSIVTLDEINQALKTEGFMVGKSLTLPRVDSISKTGNEQKSAVPFNSLLINSDAIVQKSNDLLIPILKTRDSSVTHPCEGTCQEIVQVRVYEAVQTPYQRQGSTQ